MPASVDVLNERAEVNIVISRQETQAEDETDSSEVRRVGVRERITFVSGNLLGFFVCKSVK